MHTVEKLLTAAYAAFNLRDVDAALALMQPDVDWPNGLEGGRLHGHDAVRSYWHRQWGLLDPHVEPVRMTHDTAGNWVVDVHQVVHDLSGTLLVDQMVQHIYTMKDGLIARMEIQNAAEKHP